MENIRLQEFVEATEKANVLIIRERGKSGRYVQPCNDMGFIFDTVANIIDANIDPMIDVDEYITMPSGAIIALCTADEGYGWPEEELIHGYAQALMEADSYYRA